MKLKEYPYQRFKFTECKGLFGMEIETEVPHEDNYPADFLNSWYDDEKDQTKYHLWDGSWRGEQDGSLRNFGVEYILKNPEYFNVVLQCIDEFVEYTKGIDFIKDAPGTSVHVHMNMQNEEIMTLFSVITLWVLFENVLTEYSGPFRRSNLYAIPSRVAEGNLAQYISMMKQFERDRPNAFNWQDGSSKYASLNIAPLNSLGSIEFRTLRGTTDGRVLKEWLTILNDLLLYSRGKTPEDIFRRYSVVGPLGLIREVFSDKGFLSSIDNIQGRIEETESRVYKIVRSVDWKVCKEKIVPEVKPEKKKKKSMMTPEEMIELVQSYSFPTGPIPMDDSEEFL